MWAASGRRIPEYFPPCVPEHGVALFGFILRLVDGDRQRAEDVVHETLLRAWKHPAALHPYRENPRPWLFTVARHLVIDERRARRTSPAVPTFTRLRHSWYGVMLLCSSSRGRKIVRAVQTGGGGVELVVDLAGEVALEAAQDLLGGLAFGEPALHVGLGRLVVAQSGDHGPMQGGIGLPVAAAVEPVPGGLARGGRDRVGAAQRGETGLAVDAVRVVPGCGEQGGGAVRATPVRARSAGATAVVSSSS